MNELKGPIYNQIAGFIKNNTILEFKTLMNECIIGKIVWTDKNWLHLMLEDGKELTLSINAIAYYIKR